MIPETKRANNILLYQSKNFPYDWSIKDTLVKNVRLKDPAIYLSDSLNILVASDDKLDMYMFTSESLDSEWKPFKKKIIKSGTEARVGGRFINKNNKLFLPIQNTTRGYGYGLSLFEFQFKNSSVNLVKRENLFLKRNDSIEEFSFGMHHLDLQIIDNNYSYVFDGNDKKSEKKKINMRGPIKWFFLDLKDYFFN